MNEKSLLNTPVAPGLYEKKPPLFVRKLDAVAVYIVRENKMLFLKKADNRWSERKWGIPCGRMEEGEESLETALVREVFEETGITIDRQHLQFAKSFFVVSPEGVHYNFHTFFYPLEKSTAVILSDEHQAYQWAAYEEASCLDLIPFQKEALMYQRKIEEEWKIKSSSYSI